MEELAALDGRLVGLPHHTLTSRRQVPPEARMEAGVWKGEIEKRTNELKKELQAKFDVVMEHARKEHVKSRSEKPRAKIARIGTVATRLQASLNADIDATKKHERLYKELKKKKTGKARLITAENKIEAIKHRIKLTRRKIEQLHTDKKALEEELQEIVRDEKEKFHDALAAVKSRSGFAVTGWLVETLYRSSLVVNGKEHHGDVRWSSYTGQGTWGRCVSCSVPLEQGSACTCGSLMCNHHLAYCKTCLEPACKDHRALCHLCNSTFCASHSIRCEICGLLACTGHGGACSVCSRKVCATCSQKKGLIKSKVVCRDCSGQRAVG
jgi:hypothetical protein